MASWGLVYVRTVVDPIFNLRLFISTRSSVERPVLKMGGAAANVVVAVHRHSQPQTRTLSSMGLENIFVAMKFQKVKPLRCIWVYLQRRSS